MQGMEQSKLILVGNEICPYSQRVQFALQAVRTEYHFMEVDFVNKPEWLLKKYGQKQIPFLIDEDIVLSESLDILRFVYSLLNKPIDEFVACFSSDNRSLLLLPNTLHAIFNCMLISDTEKDVKHALSLVAPSLKSADKVIKEKLHLFDLPTPIAAAFTPLFILISTYAEMSEIDIFEGCPSLLKAWSLVYRLDAYKYIDNENMRKKLKVFIKSNSDYFVSRKERQANEFAYVS